MTDHNPPPPAPEPVPGQPPPHLGVPRPGELMDRFLARLIDGVLFGVVYGILYTVLAGIFYSGFSNTVGEILLFSLFLTVLSTIAYIAYYAFFESSSGATLGKQLMKLKVMGPDGVSTPTMEQAVRRNIWYAVGLIGIIPIAGFFLGPLASIAVVILIAVGINNDTVNRQGWHDHFAGGTRVLKIG